MKNEQIIAFLGKDTEYQGQFSFKGAVRIDGRFKGVIESEGKLILGKDAHVEGTVRVGELVANGQITGDAVVTRRAVLHKTARIQGAFTTAALAMEEGAFLQGELHMGAEAVQEAIARPAAVPAESALHFDLPAPKQ